MGVMMRTVNHWSGNVSYDISERVEEMRLDLYRAVYAGDIDEVENIANLMAMVDIDRDIIMRARKEKRT